MAQRSQWLAVGGIVAALVTALVAGVALTPDRHIVKPGSEAPTFRAVDIATGDTVGLERYQGEVVLLNIWATWCGPCEVEMPSMDSLYQQLGPEGLHIVAVSTDQASTQHVREWVEERDLTFDVLHDRSGRIERLYQITGYPESFIIDREGVIVKKEIGPRMWDEPVYHTFFRRLLGTDDATVARRNQ